jgi:hypothetical protein
MQQVHLRINDAATGKPTPVRLRITDAEGRYYAPYGRLTEFATGVNQDVGGNVQLGAKKWAYIDGACEILLPPGKLHVEIAKGPEYKPIDEEVTLLAGKMSMRFTIERWCDMRSQGWYSGDTRVHFLTPDAALLEGQAEDLAVVNLLALETQVRDITGLERRAIPNVVSFSGQTFARQTPLCGVAVNTLNAHPFLGTLALHHCHRIVFPLAFGDDDDATEWTLDAWCDQCHRKGGLVVWHRWANDERFGEAFANLIRGKIDALGIDNFSDKGQDLRDCREFWWSAGIDVPLVAGSGKLSPYHQIGDMRTYAYLPTDAAPTYSAWIEAVRAGRTFISNHPLLVMTIDGQPIGRQHLSRPRGAKLALRVEAMSWRPFDDLIVCSWPDQNRDVAVACPAKGPPYRAMVEMDYVVTESSYLAADVSGGIPFKGEGEVFAHTSAQRIDCEDAPFQPNRHAVASCDAELRRLLTSSFLTKCSPAQRERLCGIFEEARTVLAKKLSQDVAAN